MKQLTPFLLALLLINGCSVFDSNDSLTIDGYMQVFQNHQTDYWVVIGDDGIHYLPTTQEAIDDRFRIPSLQVRIEAEEPSESDYQLLENISLEEWTDEQGETSTSYHVDHSELQIIQVNTIQER